MGAPRQGLNPTTNSVGFTAKLVTVRSVSADGATAIVVDRQNTQTSVSMLVQRGKGPLPAPGDTWLIAQDLGMWTFAAFVGTSGSDFSGGGSGGQVNVSDEEPEPGGEDDLWLNTASGNQVLVWSGEAWVPAQFGAAAIAPASITAAQMALGTLTSKQLAPAAGITAAQVAFTAAQIGGSRVFTGTAQPSGMEPGDMWFNAGNGNSVAVWTGQGWNPLLFSAPAIAASSLTGAQLSDEASIAATQVNFTASDIGGVTVSITAEEPADPAVGDLWYDSTHGYALKQWDGSEWAVYQYGTQAIAARAVTAELIAANTITAAEMAAGIIYAGIIDGTFVNAATFIGSVFEGADFVINSNGSFFYSGTPGPDNLFSSDTQAQGIDPYGNAYFSGQTTYNPDTDMAGGYIATQVIGGAVSWYWATTMAGPWSLTAYMQWSQNTGLQLVELAGYGVSVGQGSWQSLGSCGSTGCTLEQGRYRMTSDGECEIDIALVAGGSGSTAGTYTWSASLPSGLQFSGSYLRIYQLAYNTTITGGAEAAIIAVDGNGTGNPGRVRITIPALASGVCLTGTPKIPLN